MLVVAVYVSAKLEFASTNPPEWIRSLSSPLATLGVVGVLPVDPVRNTKSVGISVTESKLSPETPAIEAGYAILDKDPSV